jgi:hypothetical protein
VQQRRPADPDAGHDGFPVNGEDPVLGLHSANPNCTAGQRIHQALVGLDRRAAAALVAELEHTTLGDLVQQTTAAS